MTNFSDMLSKAKVMQDKMKEAQDQIKKIEVEGEAGGNLVKVILSGKNLGYGAAIKTIFNESKKIDGDVLVTFDADGQHQISEIDSVLKPLFENNADIVIGSRFLGSTKDLPKYRKIGIKAITSLTNTVTGSNLSDTQSGFRAY